MRRMKRLGHGASRWATRVLRECNIRRPNTLQREVVRQLAYLQERVRESEHGATERERRTLISQWGKCLDRLKATRTR